MVAGGLPSLNGLRAFEAAARHLSFTRAADELHVTQTAISHQIRRLEEQLGVPLFERRIRAVALTPQGAAYLPAVRGAFEDLRRATERLVRDDGARLLTISTTVSFAVAWLVPRLGAFQRVHPEIEVRLDTSSSLANFRTDGVDVAIRHGQGNWPGLTIDWLMKQDMYPVCSPALLKGRNALRTPADLDNHTLLHVTSFPEDWRVWLRAAGYPRVRGKANIHLDLAVSILDIAVRGGGVAITRSTFAETDLAAGTLVKPFDITLDANAGYYFVCPPEAADRPKVKAFRNWLRDAVHESAAALASNKKMKATTKARRHQD